jgi:hypothetical protein
MPWKKPAASLKLGGKTEPSPSRSRVTLRAVSRDSSLGLGRIQRRNGIHNIHFKDAVQLNEAEFHIDFGFQNGGGGFE